MELENVMTISYEKLLSFIRNYYYEMYKISISNERLVYKNNTIDKSKIKGMESYFLFEYETFNKNSFYTYEKLLSDKEITYIINYYLQSENVEVIESSFYIDSTGMLENVCCKLTKAKSFQKVKE